MFLGGSGYNRIPIRTDQHQKWILDQFDAPALVNAQQNQFLKTIISKSTVIKCNGYWNGVKCTVQIHPPKTNMLP